MAKGFIYSINTVWKCPRCQAECDFSKLCPKCMSQVTPEELEEWKKKVVGLQGQVTQR